MNELLAGLSKGLDALSQSADSFYRKMRQHVEESQTGLKDDEQLEVLYHTHGGVPILVTDIGYHNPNLLIISGRDTDDKRCTVLVHMQSVELLLRTGKVGKKGERKRIGFHTQQ